MKRCYKCNNYMQDEDIFCHICGTKYVVNTMPQVHPNNVPPQVQQQQIYPQQYISQQPFPYTQPPVYQQQTASPYIPKNNSRAIQAIVWGIIALFAFILILCLKIYDPDTDIIWKWGLSEMKEALTMYIIWFVGLGIGSIAVIIGFGISISNMRERNYTPPSIVGLVVCILALLLCFVNLTKLPNRIHDCEEINQDYINKKAKKRESEERLEQYRLDHKYDNYDWDY